MYTVQMENYKYQEDRDSNLLTNIFFLCSSRSSVFHPEAKASFIRAKT